VVQPEIAGDGLLVLGDGLLAFAVELYQARVNSQLRRAEAHELVGRLEWLLLGKPIEETDEGNLVGEAKPIVGAPALANLPQVFFGQGGGAFELLAGEHLFVYTPAINFCLWP
jgi:2-keto-3-deoxy-galactonokinase